MNAKTVHWDGQNLVRESNGSGGVKATYLRGAGLVAQVIDLSLFYYLLNAHGDVVQRVDAKRQAAPRYEYDAFGVQRERVGYSEAKDPNPLRYCGEYFDSDVQEYYLRARTYQPGNGRFTQEDPAKDGGNWYSYCGANPVTRTDPSGLASVPMWDFGEPGGYIPPKKPEPFVPPWLERPRPEPNPYPGYNPNTMLDPISGKGQEQLRAINNVLASGASIQVAYSVVFEQDPMGGGGYWSGNDFGDPTYRGPHRGVDVHTNQNTNVGIYSVWYGLVDSISGDASYGELIVIALTDENGDPITDDEGRQVYIRLAHLKEGSRTVAKGDTITYGIDLGIVGRSGTNNGNPDNPGSGVHLHFEAFVKSASGEIPIDPWPYLYPGAPRPLDIPTDAQVPFGG